MAAIDLAPGSPAWTRLITASKVAAILGVSPENWESKRSLWLKMRGDIPWDDGRNVAEKSRGHYLENGLIDWWADQHPEIARVRRQPIVTNRRLPWAAATPDAIGTGIGAPLYLDAKTSRDDAEWGTPGTDEVPAYYAAQLTWAMHLSHGRRGMAVKTAHIALLTQFLDLREYVIEYDAELGHDIEDQCRAFLRSLDDPDAIPPVDGSQATWRAEKRRHPDIDLDKTVELDGDLAQAFVDIKAREADVRAVQSRLREVMGDARLATYGGVTIARRQPNAHGVTLMPVAKAIPTTKEQHAA
ncbi:YqaJ viral recombinase family protein [Cellulomonas rhizosphaerae]|uniref:YqaJ viral recombinase domain-containing protein n=1 Tax=Cellulomonas rhizosphaerae TaxID=2293719 RepID=A0A413RJE2_9CELL|nr:YqaJ viral recombinase family protein [Cellulomonas rhizosphaerae]RHA38687.1 hypothetical protein D1825_13210 [Cellulomonas rhizosphaerae]